MIATEVLYTVGLGLLVIASVLLVVMLACGITRGMLHALGSLLLIGGKADKVS